MTILAHSARRRIVGGDATPITSAADVGVLVNQSGYDVGRPKRATVTNTADGALATVLNLGTGAVTTAEVTGGKVDFTSLDTPGTYQIECNGSRSDAFRIGRYWNQRVSTGPALAFMNEARKDTFQQGLFGVAWRDSHQFSFELHSLVAQYSANPAAYTRLPYGIIETATSEYAPLRVQDKPDIVWLIEFAARRYLDLETVPPTGHNLRLHALVKGQLPFFLWLYPAISEWVPESLYDQVHALAEASWAEPTTDLSWYDTGSSNNLFLTQDTIGDAKGAEPPGHKILPNLLMWEIAQRDGHAGGQAYLDAAVANAAWLISLDITNPAYTKGQRMSERITMTGLCHMLETHPELVPSGAQDFIQDWIDVTLARSQNMWDFRMYSAQSAGDATDQWLPLNPSTGSPYNEPGNIAGLPAALLAARRVTTDPADRADLLTLAQAQFDQVFGRNPNARHFSFRAVEYFEGVERGWHKQFDQVGAGVLGSVPGVLDGAPTNTAYPFDPTKTGYTEGWVAFNTAWNHALAYDAAEDVEVSVLQGGVAVTSATQGSTVTLKLRAPLNFNEAVIESGWVEVSVDGGTPTQVAVTEASVDDWYFTADWTVPAGASFTIGYGYGLFRQEATVTIH